MLKCPIIPNGRCRFIASAFLALSSAGGLKAGVGPVTIDVPAFFDGAQVVVLGDVTGISSDRTEQLSGPQKGEVTVQNIELSVVNCYKPANDCGSTVTFSRRFTVVDPLMALKVGEEVLAFLQGPGPIFTQPNYWSVWNLDWMRDTRESRSAAGLNEKELLQADLASGLNSPDSATRLQVLQYLRGFQPLSASLVARVRKLAESDSTPIGERLEAVATLLADPKPQYVGLVSKLAESEPAAVLQHPREAWDVRAAFNLVKDQRMLPDLIAIAQSPVEMWHFAGIYGLRNLHNPTSVPVLIKALDDPDLLTEYEALITLAEITHKGGDYGPGLGPFRTNPKKYIGLWKEWWETEGRSEYER